MTNLEVIMNPFMLAVNVAMAFVETEIIREAKPIKHGWWAFAYAIIAMGITVWIGVDYSYSLSLMAKVLVEIVLLRAVTFDIALNLIRNEPWNYQSPTTTSIIDRIEVFLFNRNFLVEKLVYLALYIGSFFLPVTT